jgi:hypothetical protein
MRKLVCTPISNTIYWATVNEKKGTMNTETRIDVTDNALDVVFEHITSLEGFNKDGFAAYEFPRKDGGDPAMLCAFKSDMVTFISREKYNELLEYKAKYEGLCR